jgi:hypothetical protein
MKLMPKLQAPREVAAAALAALEYGAGAQEVAIFLEDQGVVVSITSSESSATAHVRLSPRRRSEATAGCRADALAHALHEALAAGEAPA